MATGGDDIDFEAEYDNRARVSEHTEIISSWERDAKAWRDRMSADGRAEYDLAYGPHERHGIDIFRPKVDRNGPLALFIHGGYWRSLDRKLFSHMAAGLIENGVPVALASYRLCPEVAVTGIIGDMQSAACWLWSQYNRRLLAVGHSAGGHLAACLLATDWRGLDPALPEHLVPAAVSFSGLFDLEPLTHTSINDTLGLTPTIAQEASPLTWPAPAGGWLEAFVGSEESPEYHRQSDSITKVWGEHGTETKLRIIPGANHFTTVNTLADPDSDEVTRIAVLAHSLE
ncbi:putative esterase [hydrothermal vent metagenome]|uniref:Putative esterase n=1 Tax=hydrothermal vent metagenome TaxID=652676 RepID=A0A3B0T6J4_9ZZZZ